MTLASQVESLLFALGRRATVDELAHILKVRDHEKVLIALQELKEQYSTKGGPIIVLEQDGGWKMTVQDEHLPLVRRVVSKTELPKGVMETLAIIAYKTPMLQSELVKMRTNKAYDHLAALEAEGFVTREKQGRTKLIKLGKKFFDYFDIPEDKLKERFQTVAALEQVISNKETEIESAKSTHHEMAVKAKQEEDVYKRELVEKHKQVDSELAALPEIDLVDNEGHVSKLEGYESQVYDEPEKPKIAPEIKPFNEPEIYKVKRAPGQPKEPKPESASPNFEQNAAPPEKAQPVQSGKEPAKEQPDEIEAALKIMREKTENEKEGPADKYSPEGVEAEAHEVASKLEAKESKGLFAEGVPEEVKSAIEKRARELAGEKTEEPTDEGEQAEPINEETQEKTE